MNGGSLILVTSQPLKAPAAVPTIIPRRKEAQAGHPFTNEVLAMTMEAKIAIAPQERSMPAVIMIIV